MECEAAPNKQDVDGTCIGAAIRGVVVGDACIGAAEPVIDLFHVTYPDGIWHGDSCAQTAIAADGTFSFESVAPGDFYQLRYESGYRNADGYVCECWGVTDVFPLCSEDVERSVTVESGYCDVPDA